MRIEAEGSRELVALAQAANRMTDRLATEERARRNLMAAISHDLRTPITSLQLVAGALGDELLDEEERRRYAARMAVNVAALNGLIDELFELSRLEARETSWTTERVHLRMLVEETLDAAATRSSTARRSRLEDGLWRIALVSRLNNTRCSLRRRAAGGGRSAPA